MATTTPNFGWSVPTSSDLVKNGATAIETLGDAIDASLVDLKGGTTGQVLAKASNTDMDFTWSAGASVPTSLGFAAGKNKIINGDFNVWQRGTSFAISANSAYTCDRYLSDSGAMNYTFSRQSFTPATAPVAGYEGTFFFRALATSGSGGFPKIIQKIEDVRTFAGQTVTLSFWGKASSAISVAPDLIQEFGSGGSSTVYTGSVSTAITTSWARYTITYTVPSISGKTIGTGSSLTVSFNLPNSGTASFDTWGWQLEAGSTATAFQTATGTLQGELAACYRYYYRISPPAQYQRYTLGQCTGSTGGNAYIPFPVTMRVAPSGLEQVGTAANYSVTNSTGNVVNLNSVPSFDIASVYGAVINFSVSSGLTAGNVTNFMGTVSTTNYLGWSAEL